MDIPDDEKAIESLENFPKSTIIKVNTKNFIMSLKILGMRGLKSKGILPIKRAYMKIDLNKFRFRKYSDFNELNISCEFSRPCSASISAISPGVFAANVRLALVIAGP